MNDNFLVGRAVDGVASLPEAKSLAVVAISRMHTGLIDIESSNLLPAPFYELTWDKLVPNIAEAVDLNLCWDES